MEDKAIVALYWERDDRAIPETQVKYGPYCMTVAANILPSREDAEECVSDTWLQAWDAMPPHRPRCLATFLGKITRNLALNRWRHNTAAKRGGGQLPGVLEELGEVVSGGENAEQALERKELAAALDAFLAELAPEKRDIFLRRYWYADAVSKIAADRGMRPGAVSMTLRRLRMQLQRHLLERGFDL